MGTFRVSATLKNTLMAILALVAIWKIAHALLTDEIRMKGGPFTRADNPFCYWVGIAMHFANVCLIANMYGLFWRP